MQKGTIAKALAISGSPRINGNTNYLLNRLLEKLHFEHELVHLDEKNINPCNDCRGCKKDTFNCIKTDDFKNIYEKIENSNYLLFATPIYWFGPSAQMKTFIDRLRPYYGNKMLKGKKAIVILVAGVGVKDCDLTTEMFKRIFKALEVDLLGTIKAKAYDIGDAKKDTYAQNMIDKLANKIH